MWRCNVKCKVFEGHCLSWSDDNYDAPVDKTWSQTLNTFKVAVKLDPGNLKYYEDSLSAEEWLYLHHSLSGLDLEVEDTGLLVQPGRVTENGTLVGKELTWTALAETDTGSVGGIMGSIAYGPKIACEGRIQMWARRAGSSLGSIGNLASNLIGVASPYTAAVADCIVENVGTKTHWKVQFLASCVMANKAAKKIGDVDEYVGDGSIGCVGDPTYPIIYDVNTLNISHSLSVDMGDVLCGSLDLDSLAEVYDHSVSSEATARVKVLDAGWTKFGSTRPSYSH